MKRSYDIFECQAFDDLEPEYPVCDALEGIPGVSVVFYNNGCLMKNELPGLVFSASPEVGYLISRLLNRCWFNKETRFHWNLVGEFSREGVLQFHISLVEPRLTFLSFLMILRLHALRRDLSRMAQLLRTERSLYWCEIKALRVCLPEE